MNLNDKSLSRVYALTYGFLLVILLLGNPIHWFPYISYSIPFFAMTIYLSSLGKWEMIWSVIGNKIVTNSLILIFIGTWIVKIVFKYYSISYSIWDTGIFANSIFNSINGHGFYSSILQVPQLSDHFCPNLLLLAPILKVFPNGIVLILVRFIGVVYSIFLIGQLCKVCGIESKRGNFFKIMWIMNFAILGVLNYEFQPSSLVIPFIFLMVIFYKRDEITKLVICCIIILGFKEQTSIIVMFLGTYVFFIEKKYLKGIIIGLSGLIAGLLIFFVITPWITGVQNTHHSYFEPLANLNEKLKFVFITLKTTGFMPVIFGLRYFLVLVPGYSFNLVTNQFAANIIGFHYPDIPCTILMCTSILSFGNIESRLNKGLFYKIVFSCSLIIAFNSFVFPTTGINHLIPTAYTKNVYTNIVKFRSTKYADYALYTQDCIGFYFSDKYKLATYGYRVINQDENHCILLGDSLNPWPLNDIKPQIINFQQLVDEGKYKRLDEFYPLIVFSKTVN